MPAFRGTSKGGALLKLPESASVASAWFFCARLSRRRIMQLLLPAPVSFARWTAAATVAPPVVIMTDTVPSDTKLIRFFSPFPNHPTLVAARPRRNATIVDDVIVDDELAWTHHETRPDDPLLSCYVCEDGTWMCAADAPALDADASF